MPKTNARQRWLNSHYEQIAFRVRPGDRAALAYAAKERGLSASALVVAAVNQFCGEQVLTPLGPQIRAKATDPDADGNDE